MKKITLSVDIRYHQLFRATSRHHKVWSAPVLTVSDVSLTVITDPAEFPLAFKVRQYGYRARGATTQGECYANSRFGIHTDDIRCLGKKLYKVVRYTHGTITGAPIAKLPLLGNTFSMPKCDEPAEFCVPVCGTIPSTAVLGNNTLAEVKRALRKEVSKYVVFRGAIWKVCDEPMYGYMTFGCAGDGTHVFIADKGSYARMYNALDRERFLADAANVANARMDYKDAKEIKRTKIRIDVLKPELVTNPKACR